jgi:cation-transporting ATPase 13A3/4/5
MLFSGTRVLQSLSAKTSLDSRDTARSTALVVRTAFSTLRGQLIRHILYPKPSKVRFFRDSLIYIGILFALTLVGYLAVLKHLINVLKPLDRFVKFLDLVTTAVPPLLVFAL